jgi:F0F1-type ATP synthase delta subunit
MMSNGIPLAYEQALTEAQSYVAHKEKLHELLDEVNGKAEQHEEFLIAALETLQIFVRFLRSWLGGDYYLPVASLLQ